MNRPGAIAVASEIRPPASPIGNSRAREPVTRRIDWPLSGNSSRPPLVRHDRFDARCWRRQRPEPSSMRCERVVESPRHRATARGGFRTPPTSRARADRATSASESRLRLNRPLPGPSGSSRISRLRRAALRRAEPDHHARIAQRDQIASIDRQRRDSTDARVLARHLPRAGEPERRRSRRASSVNRRELQRGSSRPELVAVRDEGQPPVEQTDRGEQKQAAPASSANLNSLRFSFSFGCARIAHKPFTVRGFPLFPVTS